MSKELQKRTIQFEMKPQTENKRIASDYYVEGYATTWDAYELYGGENPVYEQIHRSAFDNAEMGDVVFLYNHEGRVCARMSNNTLMCEVDEHGLFVCADLSKTAYAREIYEDIKSGNITQMSWAFFTSEDGEMVDYDTRTIHVTGIRRVVDVSAVSIPANNQTTISARCKQFEEFDKEAQLKEEREKEEKNFKHKKLNLLLKIGGH